LWLQYNGYVLKRGLLLEPKKIVSIPTAKDLWWRLGLIERGDGNKNHEQNTGYERKWVAAVEDFEHLTAAKVPNEQDVGGLMQHHPKQVWFEVQDEKGVPLTSGLRWGNEPGYPAPVWRLELTEKLKGPLYLQAWVNHNFAWALQKNAPAVEITKPKKG